MGMLPVGMTAILPSAQMAEWVFGYLDIYPYRQLARHPEALLAVRLHGAMGVWVFGHLPNPARVQIAEPAEIWTAGYLAIWAHCLRFEK